MTMQPTSALSAATALALAMLSSACAFSDLQSARLVGPGRFEVTPSYSSTSFSQKGETEKVQSRFGIQAATGLAPHFDWRLRYEYTSLTDSQEAGVSILGTGPKFRLVEDRLALHTPVGFAFGGDIDSSDTWQLQPTLLFTTYPFGGDVEITISGRGVIWLNDDAAESLLGANLGLGLSSDFDRWVVRPEIGFLKDPGGEGTLWQWSVGFSILSSSGN